MLVLDFRAHYVAFVQHIDNHFCQARAALHTTRVAKPSSLIQGVGGFFLWSTLAHLSDPPKVSPTQDKYLVQPLLVPQIGQGNFARVVSTLWVR